MADSGGRSQNAKWTSCKKEHIFKCQEKSGPPTSQVPRRPTQWYLVPPVGYRNTIYVTYSIQLSTEANRGAIAVPQASGLHVATLSTYRYASLNQSFYLKYLHTGR